MPADPAISNVLIVWPAVAVCANSPEALTLDDVM